MKKHSLAEFFKSKSFYALLCVGALAIIAITAVSLNQSSNQGQPKQNLVDLNETDVAEGDEGSQTNTQPNSNNGTSSTAANNEDGTSQTEVAKSDSDNQGNVTNPVAEGSNLENDAEDDPKSAAANPSAATDKTTADSNSTQAADAAETTASNTESTKDSEEVMNTETLYFDAEDGLLWPVTGNILMDYSVDRVIYDATLEQFRTNPAVVIDAEVGTEVVSAAKGVITSIKEEDETGLTVTQSLGNGYSLVYGQLKGVKFKEGDVLEAGEVLGLVAEPSKYYTVEGSNLYFQVVKDEDTVNPMLLLN